MQTTTDKKENGVLVISLEGRLDANTSGELQKQVEQLIESGETLLLINFAKLDYISSAGLRVLITALKRLKTKQGKLALSNMSDTIFEVLKVSGFASIFNIVATEEEALNSF